MSTGRFHSPAVDHHDFICIFNGFETVGNNDNSLIQNEAVQTVLDLFSFSTSKEAAISSRMIIGESFKKALAMDNR